MEQALDQQWVGNIWNKLGCSKNEQLIMPIIDTIVFSGLAKAGYTFVNIDDFLPKDKRCKW